MKKFKFAVFSLLFFSLLSCSKSDPEPKDAITGTWKIKSITIKDADGSTVDYWSLIKAFYPCADNITYTFDNGTYTTNTPAGCVDEDGQSLALLAKDGGSYVLTDNTISVNVDGDTLPGAIEFSGNLATVTTLNPDDLSSTLIIVFEKA